MIKDTILIIVPVLFWALSLQSQEHTPLEEAHDYYEQQDYIKAFAIYSACAESEEVLPLCCERAGLSAYQLGDIPSAKKYFLALEAMDSLNPTALIRLSSIYDMEKNIPKAIKYYTKLTGLYPDNPVYYRKLAQQYQEGGLRKEAYQNYSKAFQLNPRDMFAIAGIAEIQLANRQYEVADSLLRTGLSLDSLNVKLSLLMAQSKYRQKQFDSTVYYLDKITYEVDLSPYFNKMFGYACIQIDSFEKSIPLLEKSLLDEGSREYAHYYLATAYEKLDSMDYALFHYQKALEEGISANTDLYHRNLARLYKDRNSLRKAIDHYRDAYKYGGDPLLLFHLARASEIYYRDKSIAINYYKKYLSSGEDTSEYLEYSRRRLLQLQEQEHQGM